MTTEGEDTTDEFFQGVPHTDVAEQGARSECEKSWQIIE